MRFALAVAFGSALLGLRGASAQPLDDPAAAVANSAGAEAEAARRARQVGRAAVDPVFGGVAPAPADRPSAPPETVSPAPDGDGPTADDRRLDGSPEAEPGAEVAAPAAALGRDPFRPFTLDLRPETREEEIVSPLQRYELSQLRLAGVVVDLLPPRAMLQDNSGMGFIVTPGTPIGRRHGIVKSIEPRRVVVEELALDYYGRQQLHQVVIEMPKDDAPEGVNQGRP